MKYFQYLFRARLHTGPFSNLRTIKWRAEQILGKVERTPDELDAAALQLRSTIDEHKESRANEEFERHVYRLYEKGGWELSYLTTIDEERGPTVNEIRYLLKNWPSWADDRASFAQAEDFDDLESLQDIMDRYRPIDEAYIFGGMNEFECYALLALMKLDAVAGLLNVAENAPGAAGNFPERVPLPTHFAVWAGNLLVEAMEIICYAERQLYDAQSAAMLDKHRQEMDAQAQEEQKERKRKAESDKARTLANIRWAEDSEKRTAAKALIKRYWDIWSQDRSRYKNQGEFARDMEEKIEAEIGLTAKLSPLYSANTIEVKLIPQIRSI